MILISLHIVLGTRIQSDTNPLGVKGFFFCKFIAY